jgi:hypothetical protein
MELGGKLLDNKLRIKSDRFLKCLESVRVGRLCHKTQKVERNELKALKNSAVKNGGGSLCYSFMASIVSNKAQPSMEHDHESHQQKRLPRILLRLHEYRQQ